MHPPGVKPDGGSEKFVSGETFVTDVRPGRSKLGGASSVCVGVAPDGCGPG